MLLNNFSESHESPNLANMVRIILMPSSSTPALSQKLVVFKALATLVIQYRIFMKEVLDKLHFFFQSIVYSKSLALFLTFHSASFFMAIAVIYFWDIPNSVVLAIVDSDFEQREEAVYKPKDNTAKRRCSLSFP